MKVILKNLPKIIFCIPILVIIFIFREVIFSDKIFAHLDVLLTFFPYYHALFSGGGFIEPGILSGFPLSVSITTTWFSPLNTIFFYFFDAFDVFRFSTVLYVILAYIFTYLFARRIGATYYTSIIAGTVFIFAGQVMLWSETIIITVYYFLLPVALYLVDYALLQKGIKKLLLYGALGLALGIGWLSGHVQFLVYIHTLIFAYWFFWVYKRRPISVERRVLFRYWIAQKSFLAFSFLISFLVGIPQIMTVLNFLPLTSRIHGVSLGEVFAYGYVPWHLIHYILPSFTIPYISVSQTFHNYIGILPFGFFILTLYVWKKLRHNSQFAFFGGVFLFCFIASIKYSPLALVLHYVPFYSTFREATRMMFIGDFALAIMLAFGVEYIWSNREVLEGKINGVLKYTKKIFSYCIAPCIVVVSLIKIFFFDSIETFLQNYFLNNLYKNTVGGFSPEHYYQIINVYLHQALDQFSVIDKGVVIALVCGIFTYFFFRNLTKFSYIQYMSGAVVLIALNAAWFYSDRIHGIPKNEILTAPATAQFILSKEKQGEPFRIFSPLMDVTIYNESNRCNFPQMKNWDVSREDFLLRRELIEPDMNILYGLQSPDGYEPYVTRRVSDMTGYVGSRFSTTNNYAIANEKVSLEKKIATIIERKNIYRSMNVKYILTLFPLSDKDFTLVFSEDFGKCPTKVYIYELSNPWPRYFVTREKYTIAEESPFITFAEFLSLHKNPVVVLEGKENATSTKTVAQLLEYKVTIKKDESDRKEFDVTSREDGHFVFGIALLPGWSAYVDGVLVPIEKANYIYGAVPITSGNHTVELQYVQ